MPSEVRAIRLIYFVHSVYLPIVATECYNACHQWWECPCSHSTKAMSPLAIWRSMLSHVMSPHPIHETNSWWHALEYTHLHMFESFQYFCDFSALGKVIKWSWCQHIAMQCHPTEFSLHKPCSTKNEYYSKMATGRQAQPDKTMFILTWFMVTEVGDHEHCLLGEDCMHLHRKAKACQRCKEAHNFCCWGQCTNQIGGWLSCSFNGITDQLIWVEKCLR